MKGLLIAMKAETELKIIEAIELDGHISTCRHPHIRMEHIKKINALFEEFHHNWRVADEQGRLNEWGDELFIFHTHHPRVSSTV